MIAVAIMGLLMAIAVPNFLKARARAQHQTCLENLFQIESAKQIWGVEKGKKDGDIPVDADLIGPTLYMKVKPICPASGEYDYKAIGTPATCDSPGHIL